MGDTLEIKYGPGSLNFDTDGFKISRILKTRDISSPPPDPIKAFRDAIESPVGTEPLGEMVSRKKPEQVAIIVEDKTRKNPEYPRMLHELIDGLQSWHPCRIGLIAAYGAHPKHSAEEHRALYGQGNLSRVTLIDHDSRDSAGLASLGALSTGNELWVNRYVSESDFLITFGTIEPHAFAGFTGGRKLILPGVSGIETIRRNHSMVCRGGVGFGNLGGNPIHVEMAEAERKAGVDFIINYVRDAGGGILRIFAGDPVRAYAEGTAFCSEVNAVTLKEEADVVFVSCGGHPKDRSLYHAQRAISSAVLATRKSGSVVVFGEFPDGVGNNIYREWLSKPLDELLSLPEENITIGVHSAYLTARNLNHCEIVLFTGAVFENADKFHLRKISDMKALSEFIRGKHGDDYSAYLIPNGSRVLIRKPGGSGRTEQGEG